MKLHTLIQRFHGICFWCGKNVAEHECQPHPDAPTRDHVIPISRGGSSGAHNIVLACYLCNQAKADTDPLEISARWLFVHSKHTVDVLEAPHGNASNNDSCDPARPPRKNGDRVQ